MIFGKKILKIIPTFWKNAGITLKFGWAIGTILLLIIAVTVISIVALDFSNKKSADVQESTDIQQLVLEMNLGLQNARINERNFFIQYPIIGIDEARRIHAQPAVSSIAMVISQSEDLRVKLDASTTTGASLQDSDIDLNLYLSAAERNVDIFLDAIELVSRLAAPDTGLESQLTAQADALFGIIENEDPAMVQNYYQMRLAEAHYLQTRQRPFFQTAFNEASVLQTQISTSETLSDEDKTSALDLLDQYEITGGAIIEIDVELNSIFNDFALQDESVNPISEALILSAEEDVQQAQNDIEDTARLIQRLLILAAVIAISIAISAAIVLNQSVTRNIIALTNTAEQLEKGNLSARSSIHTGGELGALSSTLNSMADQLKSSIDNLEERVQSRTRDLEIAAEISKEAVAIVDPVVLLPRVTKLTAEGFKFYFASVHVFDEETQLIKFAAGSSEKTVNAANLLNRKVHIDDNGIIPRAARERVAVVINNVETSATYVPLPELPATKSEAALPMLVGDQVIGVLDLQADTVDYFGPSELKVLQTLADRIAVTIQNAQLFAEQVEIAEQLKLLDKLKSQFLAGMSHELRTPLNAIINFTQFVANGTFGEISPEQLEILEKVIRSGRHLLSLINDVLDFSKIEVGMLQLFRQDVNVHDVLQDVKDTALGLEIQDGVELQFDYADNLPTSIHVDKRRLRQILINLVSNAVKFTETGSIVVKAWVEDDYLQFSVQDTGVGIESEQIDIVFEAFRQSDIGHRTGKGTGLGLPISRYLAEAHGGQLWVESEEGQGSTFYVRLPLEKDSKQASET